MEDANVQFLFVRLGDALEASGVDAAIAEYQRLKRETADEYDFDEQHFSHATGSAIWMNRPDVVMPPLDVCKALFPNRRKFIKSEVWPTCCRENLAAAETCLKTAMALDPDNATISKLMQR